MCSVPKLEKQQGKRYGCRLQADMQSMQDFEHNTLQWACLHCFHRNPVWAGRQGQALKKPDQAALAMHWAPRQVLRSQWPCQVRCSQGISIFKNVELHLKAIQHTSVSREG